VSPRRNRRQPGPGKGGGEVDPERVRQGIAVTRTWTDGEWTLRLIPRDAATKTYRCPGCDQEIPPGTQHVVAWPADGRGDLGDRRHWHNACWEARDRRAPNVRRAHRGRLAP
jgi:hypothetical protein